MSAYSGVAKDGPAEGHELTSEHQYVDVPLPRRRRPAHVENDTLAEPDSYGWERARYVHITDHWGRGWWLWEHGWLIKLLQHVDRDRYTAIGYLLG